MSDQKFAGSLRIDELAAATSRAVASSLEIGRRPDGTLFNPKIWIGIWIDLEHQIPGLPQTGPIAGGPVG